MRLRGKYFLPTLVRQRKVNFFPLKNSFKISFEYNLGMHMFKKTAPSLNRI